MKLPPFLLLTLALSPLASHAGTNLFVNNKLYKDVLVLDVDHDNGYVQVEHHIGISGFKFEDLPIYFRRNNGIVLTKDQMASLRREVNDRRLAQQSLRRAQTQQSKSKTNLNSKSSKVVLSVSKPVQWQETRFVVKPTKNRPTILPLSQRRRVVGNKTNGHRIDNGSQVITQVDGDTVRRSVGSNSNNRSTEIREIDSNQDYPRSVGSSGQSDIIQEVSNVVNGTRTVGNNSSNGHSNDSSATIKKVTNEIQGRRSVNGSGGANHINITRNNYYVRRSIGSSSSSNVNSGNAVITVLKGTSFARRSVGSNSSSRSTNIKSVDNIYSRRTVGTQGSSTNQIILKAPTKVTRRVLGSTGNSSSSNIIKKIDPNALKRRAVGSNSGSSNITVVEE